MNIQVSVFCRAKTGEIMPYAHQLNDDDAWGVGRCVFDETPEYTRLTAPKMIEINFDGKQD